MTCAPRGCVGIVCVRYHPEATTRLAAGAIGKGDAGPRGECRHDEPRSLQDVTSSDQPQGGGRLTNARHANLMAKTLAAELARIPGIQITREVQTNMVYCTLPRQSINVIREEYLFYVFDETQSEVRLVTSYDTTEADVQGFLEVAQAALAAQA